MDDIKSQVAVYVFPALLGITIYFIKRFIDRVDKEIERLSQTVGKSAIGISERTGEIKISLATLELAIKGTSEKVQEYSHRISECVTKLDKHSEMHSKTSEILAGHAKSIEATREGIKTIVRVVGENTIVSERKRK